MQNHPATIRTSQIPTKNILSLCPLWQARAGWTPSVLCRYLAEEINCGELIILAGGSGFLGSTAR